MGNISGNKATGVKSGSNKAKMVNRIKSLDVSVINKIAAGEIVVAPVNALKEMMENSIDAHATMIDILVKDGGLKLLQITDNGTGIQKEDLSILCERFTTSKLEVFEDLGKIETFGFRGEALASISHIARVTVITKTDQDECAWKVSYSEGKMLGEPKPVAGKTGTVITVEDLFYNIPSRLKALRSPAEEFNKILDIVGRYSVNNSALGFSCKKYGDSKFALVIKPELATKDRIRVVFGANVSSKVLDFHADVNDEMKQEGLLDASGMVTDLDFTNKKSIPPAFFINGRLVSCDPLRRSLNQIYSTFLPKGNKPFVYLALSITPQSVDVNIHPTKREVRFLHEEEIIDFLSLKLQEKLASIDTSRTFKTTSFAPNHNLQTNLLGNLSQVKNSQTTSTSNFKKPENKLVRIDMTQSKLTNYLRTVKADSTAGQYDPLKDSKNNLELENNTPSRGDASSQGIFSDRSDEAGVHQHTTLRNNTYFVSPKKRVTVNLTSIKKLKEKVDEQCHSELTNVFAHLTYVGIVDESRRLASIQCDLKLFLVDYGSICNELFYQIGLSDFCNFGRIILYDKDHNEQGFSISSVLKTIDSLTDEKVEGISEKLINMKEMLEEYFSIELEKTGLDSGDIKIKTLPLLLKDYNPPLSKLPLFLYRLGTQVNWEDEYECLDGILRQLALFYIPPIIERVGDGDSEAHQARYAMEMHELTETMDHVVFPAIKKRLLAPKKLLKDVVEVANLPGLYKVFERC